MAQKKLHFETLRYVLKNGDQVSILTSNNQQPNADWLNIATTSKARNKIRQFLTEDSRAQATLFNVCSS